VLASVSKIFICSIIALGKKAFYEQIAIGQVGQAYAVAEKYMVQNLCLADAKEGIDAFVQKRHPNWNVTK
jgi:hypothetical protein